MRYQARFSSESGLQKLALRMAEDLMQSRARKRATLMFLEGELGSGKTTFVKALARGLGVRARVHSPTFVFAHEHPIPQKAARFAKLIHADAYRMRSRRDVLQTGLRGYLENPKNLLVIEWGKNIARWISQPDLKIEFRHHSPLLREINYKFKIQKSK